MLRFVDLRLCGCHEDVGRFAWWDTVTDKFLAFGVSMAWDTAQEFREDYDGDDWSRFYALMPDWSWDPPGKSPDL